MQIKYAAATISLTVLVMTPLSAVADDVDAKRLLRSMSDFLTTQKNFEFDYDATWEVVTTDAQKLGIATSGSVSVSRPNQIRASNVGGFADSNVYFDGETLAFYEGVDGLFAQVSKKGSIEDLVEDLRSNYGRSLPAADLIVENPYEILMQDVTDVKDLGSGYIAGQECDHLAFRTPEVDWQIWISQSEQPYPCRYVITSHGLEQGPQYQVDVRNWQSGNEGTGKEYSFAAPEGATELPIEEFVETVRDLPSHYRAGDKK